MLIINPSKPFYINSKKRIVRMGNFTQTGKEIEYEDDIFLKIFDLVKEPIQYNDLVHKLVDFTNYAKEDIENTIDYLIEEKFISNFEDINTILKDDYLSREKLYFYMLNDKVIDVDDSILNKNILILGVGGIGSTAIELLSRAGFKNFTIVDYDKVEKSNLIRQLSYTNNDIGKVKVDVIYEKLTNINSDIVINKVNKKIETKEDIIEEVRNSDFVLCTIDKPERIIRRIINDVCISENKPILFSGFSEHVAMIGPFIVPKKTACLSCIDVDLDDEPLFNVKVAPSFGPMCSLISSIVSNEIINYFIKFKKDNLVGKTMMFNMYNYESKIIKWQRNNNCVKCGDKIDSK